MSPYTFVLGPLLLRIFTYLLIHPLSVTPNFSNCTLVLAFSMIDFFYDRLLLL